MSSLGVVMSVKLYELEPETSFRLVFNPDAGLFTFHKIDGAYSICTDVSGNTLHFGASTEVSPL